MSGPGRPSKAAVDRRRTDVARTLAKWATTRDEAVKFISQELKVGARAIRHDLEFLAQAEREPVARVPAEILDKFAKADSATALVDIERALATAIGAGRLDHVYGKLLLLACTELRQALKGKKREIPDVELFTSGFADPNLAWALSSAVTNTHTRSARKEREPKKGNADDHDDEEEPDEVGEQEEANIIEDEEDEREAE